MELPKYCKHCGCYIPDNRDKCLACGESVHVSASNTWLSGGSSGYVPSTNCVGIYKGYEIVMVTTQAKFYLEQKALSKYKYALVKDTNTVWINTGNKLGWIPCDTISQNFI